MLTWNELNILSYGAGTPSTSLALMSCQNALRGPPYLFPKVPVYDAVIFCDLHSEPSWVYEQAAFVAAACQEAGIPFYRLDADLYGDFTRNFGRARTACIPFWTLGDDGKKGKMPRQCTYDYKIKVIEKFVRYELLPVLSLPHQLLLYTTSESMSRVATPAPSRWTRWWRHIRPSPAEKQAVPVQVQKTPAGSDGGGLPG